ncbi:MAG: ArsR family transcriptional regulator [Parvularculaceae bacterium]|nr:ArsR family transcriptional regulator [Parvularculaceae bacterium]
MNADAALDAFDALSQRTRLETLRLLVRAGEAGLAAGDVARALAVPHNTMSSHLATLTAAGLARSERRGRTILYRARYDTLRDLIQFLMHDCCAGVPEICDAPDAAVACLKGECV